MHYDFSSVLKSQETLLHEFIDRYTVCVNVGDDIRIDTMMSHYKGIFSLFFASFESSDLLEKFEALAHFKISNEIPYVIISNEVYGLKALLIHNMEGEQTNLKTRELFSFFKEINNTIAHVYLHKYIEKLVSMNNLRRNSLSDLVEKNIIQHYESHLIWLSKLALHIKEEKTKNFPELDDTMCEFGKWLNGNAKTTIQNNSKYESIRSIHKNLHLFAKKIFAILEDHEYNVLITYLEKCELISLSIGTELALLDQIQLNKRVTKDTMTGALNRQALRNVFESQYELALATSNSFILAMCDLDYFKNINDTYGHIAGDKLLKRFVDTVKKSIRSSDVIIRYGGEEFVIMLPTIKKAKGQEIAESIRESFSKSFIELDGACISATVSIGMIEVNPKVQFKQSFIDEYIMLADQKLYLAKENGRNRVEFA